MHVAEKHRAPPTQTAQADEFLAVPMFPSSLPFTLPRAQFWLGAPWRRPMCVPCKAPHTTKHQSTTEPFWTFPSLKFNRIFPLIGKTSSGLESFAEWERETVSQQSHSHCRSHHSYLQDSFWRRQPCSSPWTEQEMEPGCQVTQDIITWVPEAALGNKAGRKKM